MKSGIILAMILAVIIVSITGCSTVQNPPPVQTTNTTNTTNATSNVSGTQDLVLNPQDLQQLGMTTDVNETDHQLLGLDNGTNCHTEYDYSNIVDNAMGQYTICAYNITGLNNTEVIIQLNKFANYSELNGSYGYDSSHLYSAQGLMSENDFGDQSRFRINNVNDYGGQFDNPNITYYHLWICKNLYLIHITSSGSKDAKAYISNIGHLILSKFG